MTTDPAGRLTVESPVESASPLGIASVVAFPAQSQASWMAQRMVVPVGTMASVDAARASASAAAAFGGTQDDTSGCVVLVASSDRASCCPAGDAFLTDASCAVLWSLPRFARFREVLSSGLDRASSSLPLFAAVVVAGKSCLAESCELPVNLREILPLVELDSEGPRRVVSCLAAVDG